MLKTLSLKFSLSDVGAVEPEKTIRGKQRWMEIVGGTHTLYASLKDRKKKIYK